MLLELVLRKTVGRGRGKEGRKGSGYCRVSDVSWSVVSGLVARTINKMPRIRGAIEPEPVHQTEEFLDKPVGSLSGGGAAGRGWRDGRRVRQESLCAHGTRLSRMEAPDYE